MNFAIMPERLGRIYKISGGKKNDTDVAEALPTWSRFKNLELMGVLLAQTMVFGILSLVVFRWCNQKEPERGLIDIVTN